MNDVILQLERELHKLKKKLKQSKCQLQQTRSQMEIQALRTRQLVTAWTSRLERAEERVSRGKLQVSGVWRVGACIASNSQGHIEMGSLHVKKPMHTAL